MLAGLQAEGIERAGHGFAGDPVDRARRERLQQQRNAAAQAERFTLDQHAARHLLVPPVGVEPPQQPEVASGRLFALARRAGVGQLGDLRGHAAGGGASRTVVRQLDQVLGVVGDGDQLLARQLEVDAERIAAIFEDFRRQHVALARRPADLPQHVLQRDARDDDPSAPVMDERAASDLDAAVRAVFAERRDGHDARPCGGRCRPESRFWWRCRGRGGIRCCGCSPARPARFADFSSAAGAVAAGGRVARATTVKAARISGTIAVPVGKSMDRHGLSGNVKIGPRTGRVAGPVNSRPHQPS